MKFIQSVFSGGIYKGACGLPGTLMALAWEDEQQGPSSRSLLPEASQELHSDRHSAGKCCLWDLVITILSFPLSSSNKGSSYGKLVHNKHSLELHSVRGIKGS